jgi:hypothetical protein
MTRHATMTRHVTTTQDSEFDEEYLQEKALYEHQF